MERDLAGERAVVEVILEALNRIAPDRQRVVLWELARLIGRPTTVRRRWLSGRRPFN
jgi:hypothetical protein